MMSYNLSYPNKLPDALPTTELSLVATNANTEITGELTFVNMASQASGKYEFLTFDSSGSASLQNLDITIGNGLSGNNINGNNISTIISLSNQRLTSPLTAVLANGVEEDIELLTITVNDEGVITNLLSFSPPVLSINERLLQLEQRTQALRDTVFGS